MALRAPFIYCGSCEKDTDLADDLGSSAGDDDVRAHDAAPVEVLQEFDFDVHAESAVAAYLRVRQAYENVADIVRGLLTTCLNQTGIAIHSMEARAKTVSSFRKKAAKPSPKNPNEPKYQRPLEQITDLAGVRVITFFLESVAQIEAVVAREFDIVEKTDKSKLLEQEERLGYHSVHYVVKLKSTRVLLPEYASFADLLVEVQLRTILQHAWAEIEHDMQYKAEDALPAQIRRRFMTLAGLLEIADREFQGIQEEDAQLRQAARSSVAAGQLSQVEITPDALKTYLDMRLGSDGRMSRYSYRFAADLLETLGFETLAEVDRALPFGRDDYVSRIIHGNRQGQLTRFEDVLLSQMGENYIARHPWSADDRWYAPILRARLERLREADVTIGDFVPESVRPSDGVRGP